MLAEYLERGATAGVVGGLAYGAFVALVGTPMVALAESFESGHNAGELAVHSAAISVAAGIAWGLLLGAAVFGLAWFLLEPRLPGRTDTQVAVLAVAGFVTVSGAPWLVLPPQPPGVEAALSTTVRLGLYGGMMLLGGLACAAGLWLYGRLRDRGRFPSALAGLAPITLLAVPALLAPTNPTTGPAPATLVAVFRGTTVFGQVFLWIVTAAAASWLHRRLAGDDTPTP